MPFNSDGVYVPIDGAENAFPGEVIASATWNAINVDYDEALNQLGPSILSAPSIVTGAGPFAITTEGFIVINKGSASATSVTLPAVATRSLVPLRIVDWGGNAGDITITPFSGQTIMGLATWVVGSGGVAGSGGSVTLYPIVDLAGWAVIA